MWHRVGMYQAAMLLQLFSALKGHKAALASLFSTQPVCAPEVVSELPRIPEVSIAQLTVRVIPGHVQLPLVFLIEAGVAELALGMIRIYMGIELFGSVSGKLQREIAPSCLQARHAEVSVVAHSHVQAQCFVSLERVVCMGFTYAASPGCHLLKVDMQGLICARKLVMAEKDIGTPRRAVA